MRTEIEIRERIEFLKHIIINNPNNEKAQYGARCQITGLNWVLNEKEGE